MLKQTENVKIDRKCKQIENVKINRKCKNRQKM